ncbi:MAG: T9SS type A sorting domain-containing protein [Bacteroidota bacterium]
MKKLLLLLLSGLPFAVTAQTTCANAVTVTDGTTASTTVNGTNANSCWGGTTTNAGAALKAIWYKYVPATNGVLTISSNVSGNTGDNTRLSVFTGTCSSLSCYANNDDVDPGSNFLSQVEIPVAAGTTYYIMWDNYWKATSFNFSVSLTPSDCLSPGAYDINAATNITATSATLNWDVAIGTPTGYDVDYGTVGHAAGTGTIQNTTTNSIAISGLTGPNLSYYVRTNCGATQGAWTGPFVLYLAVTVPYSNGFENDGANLDGFATSGWGLLNGGSNGVFANIGDAVIYSNTGATTQNTWTLTRAVSLAEGESVGVIFYTWYVGEAGNKASLNVTVGTAQSTTGQTVIASFPEILPTGDYIGRIATYTAPAAGTYYFGFNNVSAPTSATGYLFLDTVSIGSELVGIDDVTLSMLTIYPNPATDVINISNAAANPVSNIQIVDFNGRLVKNQNVNAATVAQVDISDLSAGIYMMNVTTEKGMVTKKIVKQ